MRRLVVVGVLTIAVASATATRATAAPVTYVRYFQGVAPFALGENSSPSAQTLDLSGVDLIADYAHLGLGVSVRESSGTAAFLDQWTITGGSGTIDVVWSLEGSISLGAPPPVCTTCVADPAIVTYSSLFNVPAVTFPGTTLTTVTQAGPGTQTVSQTGTLTVSYVSGQTFNAGFSLSGGFGDDYYGGTIDFLNSARIQTIILSDGASLTTASGAAYNVSTVPEPSSLLLMGSAGVLSLLRRRRHIRR